MQKVLRRVPDTEWIPNIFLLLLLFIETINYVFRTFGTSSYPSLYHDQNTTAHPHFSLNHTFIFQWHLRCSIYMFTNYQPAHWSHVCKCNKSPLFLQVTWNKSTNEWFIPMIVVQLYLIFLNKQWWLHLLLILMPKSIEFIKTRFYFFSLFPFCGGQERLYISNFYSPFRS